MKLKVTILGCGNSTGVPAVGNHWGSCDPAEPKNRRTRPSIAVESDRTTLVVDTGPDFREQLNRANIPTLNAVLYSHAHGDHVGGIDDLRIITYRNKVVTPVYSNKETLDELKRRFHYLFEGGNHKIYPPVLDPREITPESYGKTIKINDIPVVPIDQDHVTCRTLGYRFGDLAYCVDVWNLDEAALKALQGVHTLIIDSAGYQDDSNKVHANLSKIYRWNTLINAKDVILTSLTLGMDYQTLIKDLPQGFRPAHDGLELETYVKN